MTSIKGLSARSLMAWMVLATALLPTPVSPVMRILALVLAVFCISVHSRCMDRLFHTRLVAVLRVRNSAISCEYWVRESCICWKFRWMALICSMDTVLKHTAYFRFPSLSNSGMPTVITLVWVWLMVWVVVIFFLVRMISAVIQGENVPSASRSKADLPTIDPWANPKFFS